MKIRKRLVSVVVPSGGVEPTLALGNRDLRLRVTWPGSKLDVRAT